MSKWSLFKKIFIFILSVLGVTDVFVVLSRMQSFLIISVRLVGVIAICVIYFIIVPDSALFSLGVLPCFCCYLCLVVLIVPFWCRNYRKRDVIGWYSPRYFRAFFLLCIYLMHIHVAVLLRLVRLVGLVLASF